MNDSRRGMAASWEAWMRNDDTVRSGSRWLQWLWTLLFAAALAVFFTFLGFFAFARGEGAWRNLAGWAEWYGRNFIVCITVASTIHLMFDLLRTWWATPARIRSWQPWRRSAFFTGVPLLGVAIAWPIGIRLAGGDLVRWLQSENGANVVVGTILISLTLSTLLHYFFSAKTQKMDAERRATEAQLRLLQAQIEPHFLFNTLANVQSLMDHDLPKAKQMLASFTDYLRVSLGSMRSDTSTVAQELELAQSYLQLLQGRMEDRLRFQIDADDAARGQPLPPLLLQPLVENAVMHGLEPSIDGGTVWVRAHVQHHRLQLEVQDDGLGLDAPPRPGARRGNGVAMSNIRERLQARFGPGARLELLPAPGAARGTLARITIPLSPTTP